MKISIILPIYEVEKYLRKCLDSIINQTYSDLEIILINDGSPDMCGEICDEYSKVDNRIKVIHQENEGVSGARNCGMNIMTGSVYATSSHEVTSAVRSCSNRMVGTATANIAPVMMIISVGTISTMTSRRRERVVCSEGPDLKRSSIVGSMSV